MSILSYSTIQLLYYTGTTSTSTAHCVLCLIFSALYILFMLFACLLSARSLYRVHSFVCTPLCLSSLLRAFHFPSLPNPFHFSIFLIPIPCHPSTSPNTFTSTLCTSHLFTSFVFLPPYSTTKFSNKTSRAAHYFHRKRKSI